MRRDGTSCALRVAALALFAAVTSMSLAYAADRKDNLRLADSLATTYESALETGFDASSAGLEDYLSYAAQHSPALKAAFYQWKSVVEKSGYTGALPDPRISYTYFLETVETRVGPQNQRIMLRQSFPWFGTLDAKKQITLEAANAAYQKFQSQRLRLHYQVKSAYYEYYYLGRDITITRDNLELLGFWESVARAKYRVALKQHPDVIKAQVELGKIEDRLYTLEDRVAPAAAQLRAATNLPNDIALPVPTEIQIDEIDVVREQVIEQALSENPDLKAVESLVDKQVAVRRLAGKMSLPNFFVGLDYIETGDAINSSMPESGKDPWMATVGISVPIWFGANKARKEEADAQYRRAQNILADAQNKLVALTETIIFGYEDALRKTRLYRDGLVPKAEQSLNANYTAYQAGEADFLNLLDAQRQLLDFQLMYERSKSNLAVRRAEIEMITGRELRFLSSDRD
jgi:cobalt-zinc-cadmium efflux system outer membrane protein